MHALRELIQQRMDDLRYTSQADLVRATGLSRALISQYYNDDRDRLPQLPDVETMKKLASGLRVPYDVVLLAAAQAMGVPDRLLPVQVPSSGDLSDDELIAELGRRLTATENDRKMLHNDESSTTRQLRAAARSRERSDPVRRPTSKRSKPTPN